MIEAFGHTLQIERMVCWVAGRGFHRYPKVERSHETSVSQKQVNSREAVTLGHVLLMDAQNKLR